jgi:hypothetical protein
MLNRQSGLLVAAILLLLPNLASANEVDRDAHLSIGNIYRHSTNNGASKDISQLSIGNTRQLIARNRQRNRTPIRRKQPIYSPPAIIQKMDEPTSKVRMPKMPSVPAVPSIPNSTIQTTPTVRSSTIRGSSNEHGVESTIEQRQSVQCSGSGTSVSRSSTTINGRTISSEVRGNCQ